MDIHGIDFKIIHFGMDNPIFCSLFSGTSELSFATPRSKTTDSTLTWRIAKAMVFNRLSGRIIFGSKNSRRYYQQ